MLLMISPLIGQDVPQIMANARYASALNNIDLQGKLKHDQQYTPVLLRMKGNDIQLYYEQNNTPRGIRLILTQESCRLSEIVDNKEIVLPDEKVGEKIENTNFTYEDLSLRFLYWPEAFFLKEETIKTQKCYVIRLTNPGAYGNYKYVDVWIGQGSYAMMKMQGYNAKGEHIKTMQASDIMNVEDKIMLKKMKVETIVNDRVQSISYLILEDPDGSNKSGRPRKLR